MAQIPSRRGPGAGRRTYRRRGRLAAFLLIIAVLAAGVTLGSSQRLEEAIAPPATVSIATPESRTAEEQQYLGAILPLAERLIGEGRSLVELGESRSRNILELRTRTERFRDAADEVVRVEDTIGVPVRMQPFSTSLSEGVASALVSIGEAEDAVLRFDWDRVEVEVATFAASINVIASAIDNLEHS